MTHFYRAYGFDIQSDAPIPFFRAIPAPSQTDLSLHFNSAPPPMTWQPPTNYVYVGNENSGGAPDFQRFYSEDGAYMRVKYAQGPDLIFDQSGQQMWVSPGDGTWQNLMHIVSGHGMAYALLLRGKISLHASAVVVDGEAIIFVAKSGMGKTSTAAYFVNQGHPLIADDICRIERLNDRYVVYPAFPRIRLRRTSAQLANMDPSAVPPGEKILWSLSTEQFAQEPIPLRAIYRIYGYSPSLKKPNIAVANAQQTLIVLYENTMQRNVLHEKQRQVVFKQLGHLASQHILQDIIRPHTLDALPDIYEAIVTHS